MKHAGDETLDRLDQDVLPAVRRLAGVKEKKRGVFYRGSQAFLHFHEDAAGIFADVKGDNGWKRYSVTTKEERRQFLLDLQSC